MSNRNDGPACRRYARYVFQMLDRIKVLRIYAGSRAALVIDHNTLV